MRLLGYFKHPARISSFTVICFFHKKGHKNIQNDSLLPLLYYSFLCNFTSIYVFFLSICKKYIKYALHFLLKLLLTIHLWRMLAAFYYHFLSSIIKRRFSKFKPPFHKHGPKAARCIPCLQRFFFSTNNLIYPISFLQLYMF